MKINMSKRLLGRTLRNIRLFREAQEIGFDYILNPHTNELHYVHTKNFFGSHNLSNADLEDFIGLFNVGVIPTHRFRDGTVLPIFDAQTGEKIGDYELNKCDHCEFPI